MANETKTTRRFLLKGLPWAVVGGIGIIIARQYPKDFENTYLRSPLYDVKRALISDNLNGDPTDSLTYCLARHYIAQGRIESLKIGDSNSLITLADDICHINFAINKETITIHHNPEYAEFVMDNVKNAKPGDNVSIITVGPYSTAEDLCLGVTDCINHRPVDNRYLLEAPSRTQERPRRGLPSQIPLDRRS